MGPSPKQHFQFAAYSTPEGQRQCKRIPWFHALTYFQVKEPAEGVCLRPPKTLLSAGQAAPCKLAACKRGDSLDNHLSQGNVPEFQSADRGIDWLFPFGLKTNPTPSPSTSESGSQGVNIETSLSPDMFVWYTWR